MTISVEDPLALPCPGGPWAQGVGSLPLHDDAPDPAISAPVSISQLAIFGRTGDRPRLELGEADRVAGQPGMHPKADRDRSLTKRSWTPAHLLTALLPIAHPTAFDHHWLRRIL